METPNKLNNYWPENVVKNVLFLQNQVKVDLVSCILWQNTKDWEVTPKNPRKVATYFILMPIKGRVLIKTEKGNDYTKNGTNLRFFLPI